MRKDRFFDAGDATWRAIDAWRAPGGVGLCYMLKWADGRPAGSDRDDRRARLEPGTELDALEPEALRRLWESGAALTVTERRVVDAAGAVWLAQNAGPVWSDERGGEDATGIRFRCLSDERPAVETSGGHVAEMTEAELAQALAAPPGQASL